MSGSRSAWAAHVERNEFDDVPAGTKALFPWARVCTSDIETKVAFHRAAARRLRELATELGLAPGSYDIRSNKAGSAVSGEITLHHDHVYIQVSQPSSGPKDGFRTGVMIRTCEGRKDYHGGANNFVPLAALDQTEKLANRVRAIVPEFQAPDTDYEVQGHVFR